MHASPSSTRLAARGARLFLVAAVATAVFAALASQVVVGAADPLDRTITLHLHRAASPVLDAVMLTATFIGSWMVVIPAVIATMIYAWRRGHGRLAYVLGAGWAVAEGLNALLKLMFARARPDIFRELALPPTASFPSGHAVRSIAVYGAIAAVLCALHPRMRGVLVPAACVLVLAIGMSRVYFGVHWPSDVVAGYAFGAISLAVTVHLTYRSEHTPP